MNATDHRQNPDVLAESDIYDAEISTPNCITDAENCEMGIEQIGYEERATNVWVCYTHENSSD